MITDENLDTCKGEGKTYVDICEILFSHFYLIQRKHLLKLNTYLC